MKDVQRGGLSLNAHYNLAAFYATYNLTGLKNEAETVKCYTRAAESGHPELQCVDGRRRPGDVHRSAGGGSGDPAPDTAGGEMAASEQTFNLTGLASD